MNINEYNRFASLLALLSLAIAVALLVPAVRRRARESGVTALFPWLGFAIAAVATAGSLGYSLGWKLPPCELCWYQRIAMYPLVVILGVGAMRKESVRRFALPLAVTGIGLSGYHYLLQTFPDLVSTVCAVDVPCTAKWVNEFGFLSIPFMALSGFIAITVLLLSHRYEEAE